MVWVRLFLTHFTYVALILVLVLAGVGVPIPEDVPLIFSGYLCHEAHSPLVEVGPNDEASLNETPDVLVTHRRTPRWPVMIVAGMIGVLAGDSIVFSIGRKGIQGKSHVARHLQKVLHSKRREKVERHFARHGSLTVFTGRFFPGARSIVFAFAGMSRMSYARFLLIDGMAAAISVPLFIFLGYHFAYKIEHIFHDIERVKHIVIPVTLVLALGLLAIWLLRRRRAAQAAVNQA